MTEDMKSWFKENHTLVAFLAAQALAFATAGVSVVAYYVKMETRVAILETRGAAFTVEKIDRLESRLTMIEQQQQSIQVSLNRVVDALTKK